MSSAQQSWVYHSMFDTSGLYAQRPEPSSSRE